MAQTITLTLYITVGHELCSHVAPGHGARVRYLRTSCVNTPFFKYKRHNSTTVPVPEYMFKSLYLEV